MNLGNKLRLLRRALLRLASWETGSRRIRSTKRGKRREKTRSSRMSVTYWGGAGAADGEKVNEILWGAASWGAGAPGGEKRGAAATGRELMVHEDEKYKSKTEEQPERVTTGGAACPVRDYLSSSCTWNYSRRKRLGRRTTGALGLAEISVRKTLSPTECSEAAPRQTHPLHVREAIAAIMEPNVTQPTSTEAEAFRCHKKEN